MRLYVNVIETAFKASDARATGARVVRKVHCNPLGRTVASEFYDIHQMLIQNVKIMYECFKELCHTEWAASVTWRFAKN
eukprot:4489874-Prorocentrum_lima.AAC.1